MNFKEISLGEGIGAIKFGMSRAQVKDIVGEPDEVEATAFEDEEVEGGKAFVTESWHYDELEISISFDEAEDWMLVAIATSDPEATLAGEKFVGINKEALTMKLNQMDLGKWIHETFDSDYELVRIESAELNFWIDEGEVTEVQFCPVYEDELLNYSLN